MPNITFSVSEDLYKRMKKFSEIKWTTLYRQIIERYLEKLENLNVEKITELSERVIKNGFSMHNIPFDKAVEIYKKMRQLKWERTYSIQID
ncbi:hypothetical protein LCGC14_2120020 [marine sediment metagenome]|uniref:Uncharacterized protein n=1 Tax=marine sediment metagenome TaxID=412755 RepID=A0A0F9H0U5_9ZZZZ